MLRRNILVCPDTHNPFIHKDAVPFLCAVRERFSTTTFVHLGDEGDYHALSNYVVDADGFSAGHELKRMIKSLKSGLYKEFPHALVCKSNHPARPFARLQAAGLPRKFYRDYEEVIEAPPGWKFATSHTLDGIVFEHGHNAGGGQHPNATAMNQNMKSTVIGHHHSAFGITWRRSPHGLIFGMSCGWLGDEKAYAVAYGRDHKKQPILGCGVIQNGVPLLIRMLTNARGRWTKNLGIEMVEPGE